MDVSDSVIGNVEHAGVLDLVNGVGSNHGHAPALGDQHNVIPLQETHKPCRRKLHLILVEKSHFLFRI